MVGGYGRTPRTFVTASESTLATVQEVYEGAYQIGDALEGAAVIDAGACIGAFSTYAIDHGARHVLAIEPDPTNRLWLGANLERFGIEDRVTVLAGAVGDPHSPQSLGPGLGPRRTTVTAERDPLPTYGLDCLVDEVRLLAGVERIVLKSDCEGAEYALIGAASDQALEALERITMEWHGDIAIGRGSAAGALALMMERLLATHSLSVFGRPQAGGMLHGYRTT